jgi:hypothetical protein
LQESLEEHLTNLLRQGHSVASAAKKASPLFRVRKKAAYEVAVKMQQMLAAEMQVSASAAVHSETGSA